jgi:hypothetical protein
MQWERNDNTFRVPIKSWCNDVEEGAFVQAANLARHDQVVLYKNMALKQALMSDLLMGKVRVKYEEEKTEAV